MNQEVFESSARHGGFICMDCPYAYRAQVSFCYEIIVCYDKLSFYYHTYVYNVVKLYLIYSHVNSY